MKLLDFVVREAIIVDLQASGKEAAIREMVREPSSCGSVGRRRHGERHPAHSRARGTGIDGHRPGRGGSSYAASDAPAPGRNGRPVKARGRFCSSGWRAGRYLFSAGIAPQSARRPSQSAGEYFPTLERRTVREFLAAGEIARTCRRNSGGSRSGLALDRGRSGTRSISVAARQLSLEENLGIEPSPIMKTAITAARVRFIPLVACPRPWPIEPPMSEEPAVARRQVEV